MANSVIQKSLASDLNTLSDGMFGGKGVATIDANDAFTLGIYRNVNGSMTNTPSNNANGILLVFPSYASANMKSTIQMYCGSNGQLYFRINWAASSVSWSAWKHITAT